jgi:hypothetical protein
VTRSEFSHVVSVRVAANAIIEDLTEVYSLTRKKDGGYRVAAIPLVILKKSPAGTVGPLSPEKQKYNDQLADDLAHASRLGNHIVASTDDHHIQLTEPDLVINAIRDTVAIAVKVRTTRR